MDITLYHDRAANIPEPGNTIADYYWQGHADGTAEAAALLDPDLRILYVTIAFEGIVHAGDGVRIAEEMPGARLMTAFPGEQPLLDTAAARVTMSGNLVPAVMRCTRPSGKAPMIVLVQPISWKMPLLSGVGNIMILTLVDPTRRPVSTASLWCEAFDLTRCETALSVLLVAGHSLESAAASLNCSPGTVRVHLRSIFKKTGTSRQMDLVVLLMRIRCTGNVI